MSHAYVIARKFTHAGYKTSVEDVEMKRRFIGQAREAFGIAMDGSITVQQNGTSHSQFFSTPKTIVFPWDVKARGSL